MPTARVGIELAFQADGIVTEAARDGRGGHGRAPDGPTDRDDQHDRGDYCEEQPSQ